MLLLLARLLMKLLLLARLLMKLLLLARLMMLLLRQLLWSLLLRLFCHGRRGLM